MIALRSGRKSAFSSFPSFALLQFQTPKQRAASNSSEAPLPLFRPLFSSHYSPLFPLDPLLPLLQADISGKLGFFAVSGIFRLSPRYIPPAAVSERERERESPSRTAVVVAMYLLNADKWAMQSNFSPRPARSAAAGCREIMRSLICDAKARTWVGHLRVSVTELLVDIPHLFLRTAAFCAAVVAECWDNMSTRVRVLPLDAAAVLPSG